MIATEKALVEKKESRVRQRKARREAAADVRWRRICSAQVEGRSVGTPTLRKSTSLSAGEGRRCSATCASLQNLYVHSLLNFFPAAFFFSDLHPPTLPAPPPPSVSLRKKQQRNAARAPALALVFSVCFSRLSDPCGLSLDTNDSLLSLMPAVLAQGAQEKNRTGGH